MHIVQTDKLSNMNFILSLRLPLLHRFCSFSFLGFGNLDAAQVEGKGNAREKHDTKIIDIYVV